MVRRAAIVAVLASGCGRLAFDTLADSGANGDGNGDAAVCVNEPAPVDWLGGPVPNAAAYLVSAGRMSVEDETSKLVWERDPDPTLMTWDQATTRCASLSIDGCNAWRMPELIELETLVDPTQPSPQIDPTAFPSTPVDTDWWSATNLSSTQNNAWVVNFVNGNVSQGLKSMMLHPPCVQGKTGDPPPTRYTAAATGVADLDKNLTWQSAVDPGSYTYAAAATYCASLGASYRLPTIRELETLIDASATTSPVIDATTFPSTPASFFWTSTEFFGSTGVAMELDFTDGSVNNDDEANAHRVRCVH